MSPRLNICKESILEAMQMTESQCEQSIKEEEQQGKDEKRHNWMLHCQLGAVIGLQV
jgi:hypothetical protein